MDGILSSRSLKYHSKIRCIRYVRIFIKPVRPLFNRASREEPPPNPLSLWERARVREFLIAATLVSALIQSRMTPI